MDPLQQDVVTRDFDATVAGASPETLVDTQSMLNAQIETVLTQRAQEERVRDIQRTYSPLHADVYAFHPSVLDPVFLSAFAALQKGRPHAFLNLIHESGYEVYTFPFFAPAFCVKLTAEIQHFEEQVRAAGGDLLRPNTMNKYGVIMDHMGMSEFMVTLICWQVERVGRSCRMRVQSGCVFLIEDDACRIVCQSLVS
jgi:hypothetical protein